MHDIGTAENLRLVIEARSRRYGLTTSLEGMRYTNRYLFAGGRARNALYVGVGHGLDALLALLDGEVKQVVGVDPFIAEHGNDEDDHATLARLIADLGLAGRFVLHKGIIQDYRPVSDDAPDMVVISDVLHHVFETPERLRRSALYPEAAALFRHLREIAAPDARLVIGDVSRAGLRPLLGRIGLHQSYIDWTTKQNWREWDAAITSAGWRRVRLDDYIPHRLGGLKGRLPGAVLRYTLCNRYVMTYRSS